MLDTQIKSKDSLRLEHRVDMMKEENICRHETVSVHVAAYSTNLNWRKRMVVRRQHIKERKKEKKYESVNFIAQRL